MDALPPDCKEFLSPFSASARDGSFRVGVGKLSLIFIELGDLNSSFRWPSKN